MSRGDTSIDVSVSNERARSTQRLALQPLIRDGRSFSGRERHCCFLNTGRRRFADISAISGLNRTDDGRAVAKVDWDQDGDLDLWVSNRNGPQVRFFRNDVPTNNHYVSVRLEGVSCNRDAIGARAQLVLTNDSRVKLVKSVQAGEGFLSQSSKWIHFGLGSHTKIDRLVVDWPGGTREDFRGLVVDRQFRIVQGSKRAHAWDPPVRHVALESSELVEPPSSSRVRTFLASRISLPLLEYETSAGDKALVTPTDGRPRLLLLWASWCPPCVEELAQFTAREQELRSVGVDILALDVGHLQDAAVPKDSASAAELLSTLEFPFSNGKSSLALLDKLQIVHDQLFDRHFILPLPSSFLLDGDGQLAAIYKGPVDVDHVLIDVGKLALNEQQLRHAALEFAGRWSGAPARISLVPIYRDLVQLGHKQDATEFVARNFARFPQHLAAQSVIDDGVRLVKKGDLEAAEQRFRLALQLDPQNTRARRHLAVVLERKKKTSAAGAD